MKRQLYSYLTLAVIMLLSSLAIPNSASAIEGSCNVTVNTTRSQDSSFIVTANVDSTNLTLKNETYTVKADIQLPGSALSDTQDMGRFNPADSPQQKDYSFTLGVNADRSNSIGKIKVVAFTGLLSTQEIYCAADLFLGPGSHSVRSGPAKVITSGDTRTINYCAVSNSKNAIESINQVKITCRAASTGGINSSCHDDPENSFFGHAPLSQSQSVSPNIIQDGDEFFACWDIPITNRDIGVVEVNVIDNIGTTLDSQRVNVAPGDYSFGEYLIKTLGTRLGVGSGVTAPTGVTCTSNDRAGISTAIGCIPISSPTELVGFFLRFGVGIGGGIAFLLMVYAGFQIMTSAGNPERLKAGQELLTSAVTGLIMLIFSIFILRLIGVNILQIPGFK